MKKYNYLLSALLLLLVPFIYLALLWPGLPQRVPLHFSWQGGIDRYGDKIELLGFVASLGVAGLVVLILFSNLHRLSRLAPAENKWRMQQMGLAVLAFITGVCCWFLYVVQRGTLDHSIKLVLAAVFLLFAIIGNYMPNLKPNYFAGLRLPWTLHNENNWRKTHYLAGHLWFACGLLCMLLCLVLPLKAAIPTCGILFLAMLLYPAIYSYRLFKKQQV